MKTLSIPFWSIFSRDDELVLERSQPKPPVTKEFLEKVKGTQSKIHIYAHPEPIKIEGRAPDFQIEIILASMEERLKRESIPYDEVMISRPKYADVHLNSEITEMKGWEEVLLRKLEGKKAGGENEKE